MLESQPFVFRFIEMLCFVIQFTGWPFSSHDQIPWLLTVEHVLISCIDFDIIRQDFYTACNLKDLYHNIHPKCIISFVHAIGLTNKL